MAFLPSIKVFSKEQYEAKDKEVNSMLNSVCPTKHIKIEIEDHSYSDCNQTNTLIGHKDIKVELTAPENIYKIGTETSKIVLDRVKQEYEVYETALRTTGDINATTHDSSYLGENIGRSYGDYIDKQKTEFSKLVINGVKVEIKKEREDYDTDFSNISNIGNINTSIPYSNYSEEDIDRSNGIQISPQAIKIEVKQENEDNYFDLHRIKDSFMTQINTEVKLEDFVNMEHAYNLAKTKIKANKRKRKKVLNFVKKWIFWINLKKNKNKTHTCYFCGEIFITSSICMYHYKVYHCAKKVSLKKQTQNRSCPILYGLLKIENKESSATRYFVMYTGHKLYKCDICSKQFIQRDLLNLHQAVHSLECELCGKVCKTEDKLMEHHSVVHFGIKPYKCHLCPRKFALSSSLRSHVQAHTEEEKAYKCTVCQQDLSSCFCLKLHYTKVKLFKCEICLKEFKQKRYLEQHKVTHSKRKLFECKDCCKKYTSKCSLRQHLLLHTGEKQFKCHLCNKEFALHSYYKDHLVVHSDKRPFQCELCPKNFRQKCGLQRHLLRHKGEKTFWCEICSRSFYEKRQLKDHIRIHEDKDVFKCEVCQKSLSSRSSLRGHMRLHTGEKPFECDICLRAFVNNGNMKRHRRNHSKKNNTPEELKKNFVETAIN